MLVKAHSLKYLEDFGLELNAHTAPKDILSYFVDKCGMNPKVPTAYFYEDSELSELVDAKGATTLDTSPVVRVNALWLARDLKLKCGVADTIKKKRRGLQGKKIKENEGLFFPYAGPTDVIFHQGSVSYPLDIMFLRDNQIVKVEVDTRVGGTERWSCNTCDCVIETNGGFCFDNDVNVGDRLAYFAVSKQDEIDLQKEKETPMPFLSLAAELI